MPTGTYTITSTFVGDATCPVIRTATLLARPVFGIDAPSVSAGNSATLALGWSASSQNSAFNPTAPVFVGHYNTPQYFCDFIIKNQIGAAENLIK